MIRPNIEEFLESLNNTSPRPFKVIEQRKFGYSDIGNKTSNSIAKTLCPQDARFFVKAANESESIINYILDQEHEILLYKTAFNILCKRFDNMSSDECPPYDYYLSCPIHFNCELCCEEYALSEAKKQLKKDLTNKL